MSMRFLFLLREGRVLDKSHIFSSSLLYSDKLSSSSGNFSTSSAISVLSVSLASERLADVEAVGASAEEAVATQAALRVAINLLSFDFKLAVSNRASAASLSASL